LLNVKDLPKINCKLQAQTLPLNVKYFIGFFFAVQSIYLPSARHLANGEATASRNKNKFLEN